MTYAPAPLIALGKYLVSQGAVNLGVVGDDAHIGTGTSYHLGQSQLKPGAYSATGPRDREPALTEAASAIDIGMVGGGFPGLRTLSVWLARECANRAVDTLDIRELIYSPDGLNVVRWDREGVPPTTGSSSHLKHTHISFYRDSETRDKLAVFRRYFEGDEVNLTAVKAQRWTANGTDGALRTEPNRSLVPIKAPAGSEIISYGEYKAPDGNNWRVGDWPAGSGVPMWFLRAGPGVAPDHDFIAGAILPLPTPPAPLPDCSAEVLAARHVEYARVTGGTTIAFPEPPV